MMTIIFILTPLSSFFFCFIKGFADLALLFVTVTQYLIVKTDDLKDSSINSLPHGNLTTNNWILILSRKAKFL